MTCDRVQFTIVMKKKSLMSRIGGYIATHKKLVGVALVLVVAGTFWIRRGKSDQPETTRITRGDVQAVLVLSGTLKATEYAQLRFPTSGKLGWVGVSEGQEVIAGQALVKLNTTALYADLQKAESNLRAAEAGLAVVYDDVKGHDKDESLSQKDTRTTAEVAKDNAYRSLTQAQYNLANSTLKAPFAGFVTYLAYPFAGVNVLVTETQVEVLNPQTMYFEVAADQTEVIDIHEGQSVEILLDSFDDKLISGTVSRVALTPIPGEVGSVYKVEVGFGDQTLDLNQVKIGMTGDAKFLLENQTNVLKVPTKYIKTDKQGQYVFAGSPKNKVYITTGVEGEDETQISGDVQEGETVFN